MLTGLNHLTLAVRQLPASMAFYIDMLGFKPVARWDQGAYLTLGALWLCLSLDEDAMPPGDYTHYAFSIAQSDFAEFRQQLLAQGVKAWQEDSSEGESFYFPDPDGHKLEAHVGTLASRIARCRTKPYAGMVFFDEWP